MLVAREPLRKLNRAALALALTVGMCMWQACLPPPPGADKTYKLPVSSMEPTIQKGESIAVDTHYYEKHPIQRGDVVVLLTKVLIVKRVIALPGDTIEVAHSRAIVNGKPVDEPYAQVAENRSSPTALTMFVKRVPDGHCFVMGDNRPASYDSRYFQFGMPELTAIKGKVRYIYFSKHLSRIGTKVR